MTRIFLTGGSGFIAAHILNVLLEHGHSVVTSVRSHEKVAEIQRAHPGISKEKLDFVIVQDLAREDAFDEAIKSDPPFEVVIHTASPLRFNVSDIKKETLDPAIIGTTALLKAITQNVPTVKRVVITSSFVAMVDTEKGNRPGYVYSEKDWNPITEEAALENPTSGYIGSKTFAEKAAWDFVKKEKPNFTLATCNPPMVYGPIAHHISSLSAVNASTEKILEIMQGKYKTDLPPTLHFLWIDVRDLALAHARIAEVPEAGGKRFFVTAGYYSNREIADAIKEAYPDLTDQMPGDDIKSDLDLNNIYKYDNSRVKELLGIKFRTLKESVADTVKSLQAVGA